MQPPDSVGFCTGCTFNAKQMLLAGLCISCRLGRERAEAAALPAEPVAFAAESSAPVAVQMAATELTTPSPAAIEPSQHGQVLRLAAIGFTNAQIAAALGTSEDAVRNVLAGVAA